MLGGSRCVLEWDMEEFSVAMGDTVDWTKKTHDNKNPHNLRVSSPKMPTFTKVHRS